MGDQIQNYVHLRPTSNPLWEENRELKIIFRTQHRFPFLVLAIYNSLIGKSLRGAGGRGGVGGRFVAVENRCKHF